MSSSTRNIPKSSSSTSVQTVILSHTWVIEDFLAYYSAAGYATEKDKKNLGKYKKITSAKFQNEHFQMFLECFPFTFDKSNLDYLAVYLCLLSSKLGKVPFQFKISIFDKINKDFLTLNGNQDNLGSDYFFKKHTLNNCLVDNKLSICCEVTYITTSTKAEQGSNAPESNHFEKMANNFVKLRKNGNFSDIVLVVRGKEFRAHKFLLCAQSPVFEAMFLHDTKEKMENRVLITDVDSNVFEKLLDFIYSGKSDCVKGCEDQLLAAADKYGLENLKNACENALCVKLTPASVPDLLVLADTYNASKLKQKALDYLQTNGQDTIQAMFANNQADQLISAFRSMTIPGGSNQSLNRGATGQGINNRNIKPILKQGGNNLINFNN